MRHPGKLVVIASVTVALGGASALVVNGWVRETLPRAPEAPPVVVANTHAAASASAPIATSVPAPTSHVAKTPLRTTTSTTSTAARPRSGGRQPPAPYTYSEDGLQVTGASVRMTTAKRDHILRNLNQVLQEARVDPVIEQGRLAGFKMSRIRQGSIFQKCGLRAEDVVESINGVVMRDAAQAIQLLGSLKTATRIDLRVRRRGTPVRFTIEVR